MGATFSYRARRVNRVFHTVKTRKAGARWPVSRVLYPRKRGDGHSSRGPVARPLERPTRTAVRKPTCGLRHVPSLFGLAPGGVYPATPVAGGAVRSYRTLSPLPERVGRFAFCGTFPGVASAGNYPAPCFRGARTFLSPPAAGSGHPAIWHAFEIRPCPRHRQGVQAHARPLAPRAEI